MYDKRVIVEGSSGHGRPRTRNVEPKLEVGNKGNQRA